MPQRPEEHWGLAQEEVKSYVHKIGNLVLVGQGFNSSARNYDLETKITELSRTGIRTTSDLISDISADEFPDWNEEKILQRTDTLGEMKR